MSVSRHSFGSAAKACLLGALALSAARPAGAADDLSTWAHYQDLYYDTSPTGADVAGTVGNFPVLVRLRGEDFPFAEAMGEGQDLRFSKPDGTPLKYEIERWDSAGAKAEVWVRIDTVPGASKGVLARMHWGKPGSVSASDGNGTFSQSIGFEYVWHLGGAGVGPRPNAVASKPAAATVNYDADESKEGVAGLCDSLDGKASGDYLDIGDGYTEFANMFTVSFWAYPTRAATWARFLDLGNGTGTDNIFLARRDTSQDLAFALYNSSGQMAAGMTAAGAISLNQWQFFAVTVSGKAARIYRNGALVASADLAAPISNVRRLSNFIGRSNWAADQYYTGKVDEMELSQAVHSPNWFKLAYANQKPDQNLISFAPPASSCSAPAFAVPADTTLPEAAALELKGVADCASSYQWSLVSGPGRPILDPEVKTLQIALPRIDGDTAVVYRFTAVIGGTSRTADVKVHVREAIPNPVFTLADTTWNGKDSILIRPAVANLAAIKASAEPDLDYAWTLSGTADTAWREGGLLLRAAADGSVLGLGLCLSNNGPAVCHTAAIAVGSAVGLAPVAGKRDPERARGRRDARGRKLERVRSLPAFLVPGR